MKAESNRPCESRARRAAARHGAVPSAGRGARAGGARRAYDGDSWGRGGWQQPVAAVGPLRAHSRPPRVPSEPGLSRVPPFREEGGRLRSVTAFARKAAQPRWSPRSLRVPQACGPRASLRRGGRGSFTPPAVPVAQPGVCVDGRGTCRAVARGLRLPPPRTRVDRGVHGATRGPRVPHAFAVSSVSVCRALHAGKNALTPVRGLSLLAAPSSALATPWPSRVALPRASTSPASHTPSPHSSRSDLFRTGETGQRPSGTTLRFLLRGNPRSLPEPRSPGEDAPS